MAVLLEICVDDAAGVDAAVAGGADRIELCAALELGGLTPSAALLAKAVATGLPVHAMIRPRGGDFRLEPEERDLIVADIKLALAAGAAGVVTGALRGDRTLDHDALARFRDAAAGGAIVLHRAIDLTPYPVAATEQACALGFDHILTSGGAPTAIAGAAALARMVAAAQGRLSIIAGAGVTPANLPTLVARTGVQAVHGSASRLDTPPDDAVLAFGFASGPRRATDPAIVRAMRIAAQAFSVGEK